MPVEEIFQSVSDFFVGAWPTIFILLKSFLFAAGLASLAWLLYTAVLYRKLNQPQISLEPGNLPKIQNKEWFLGVWTDIEKKMMLNREADYKDALNISAELMERLLETLDVYGADLGDKLSHLHRLAFPNKEQLWQAWMLKKDLASNPGRIATKQEVQAAIDAFQRAFVYLGLYD